MQRRLFIGVSVPHSITEALTLYRDALLAPQIRFVQPANYHITVSFFGEQEDAAIPMIAQEVQKITENLQQFTLTFDQIALAPPKKEATMLWAQYQSHNEFTNLATTIEAKLGKAFHFTDKREGQTPIPHITLARFHTENPFTFPQITLDPVTVTEIVLYETTKTEQGSIYTQRELFPLTT